MIFRRSLAVCTLAALTVSVMSVPMIWPHAVEATKRRPAPAPTPSAKGPFSSYRNVSIGMKADEVRKSLGEPKDKSDAEDFYLFAESESMQIIYDGTHAVTAISVTLFKDLSKAPTAKDVVGENVPPNAEGSIFKTVRYPKAGFWVSYSKTGGDSPTVSITIQKI